ncbi:hypothetical protein HDF24_23120 [Mucilaginibacter sp. X4EP1]|uniref:carboxypeptidase-like regulatory domain-containing protein n=1 Tax=Mucilaginibacter sp. X4EP1 TaxID=2723092 RepID=UPI002169BA0C|nr:carboxypeptidase-like regulatory domain-containing protein [Mucilaginibacter sp. X4EP1]MCS3816026.1 hypothetical protein [Mucilaginibacter sp. X4EP1]
MISFIKAKIWSGAGWLLALCLILISVTIIYFLLHSKYKGTDHKKLDSIQLANLDNIFAGYPDITTTAGSKSDSVKIQRQKRNQLIFVFLKTEYNNQVDSSCLKDLNQLLLGLGNKDAKLYLTGKEIIVKDFFWFTGELTYLEVILWALIGVLVSLIYYVSLANVQALKQAGDADTGPFDTSEISVQVAKMFYAPVCALVLVLGYNLLNSDSKMTDITIGKGLLLFAFICGFFSGRVIKFIDRLKDLVLPISDSTSSTTTTPTTSTDASTTNTDTTETPTADTNNTTESIATNNTGNTTGTAATTTVAEAVGAIENAAPAIATNTIEAVAPTTVAEAVGDIENAVGITNTTTAAEPAVTDVDVTVNLQLAPAVAQSPDGPDIVEAGFNNAKVSLQSADGNDVITLSPPTADEGGTFTTKQLPFGDYTVTAEMAYKNTTTNTIINLSASQTITVNADSHTFDVPLNISPVTG